MRARRLPVLLGLLSLPIAACGSDPAASGGSGGGSGSTTTSTGSGQAAVPCDGAPATPALGGTWAARGRLSISFVGADGGAITICPADQLGESTLLLLVRMEQDPADATKLVNVGATLCSLELPSVTALVGSCQADSPSLLNTQILAPDALISALPSIATTVVGGSVQGDALTLDRFQVNVGTAKTGDAMPQWDAGGGTCASSSLGHTTICDTTCVDDCAALRDDDADGYPGVTVDVCGTTPSDESAGLGCHPDTPNEPGVTLQGRAFLDIQVDPQFTGTVTSSCELEGTVDTSVLYHVVGADVYLAGGPISVTSAIKSLPAFTVHPEDSSFRMVRVDGQYGAPDFALAGKDPIAACAEVIQRQNEL